MKRTILAAGLGLGAILGSPRDAKADCLIDAVQSCDADFAGTNGNYYTIAIRGWCYIIRDGICNAGTP